MGNLPLCHHLNLFLPSIPERLPDLLDQYIRKIRTIHPDQSGYHDCLDVLRVFGPSIRRLLSYGSGEWEPAALGKRFALIKTFNKLVQEVDRTSHQIQVRRILQFGSRQMSHQVSLVYCSASSKSG